MPPHDASAERRPHRARRRGPWQTVAALACVGVGLVAGAATAQTWDVPGVDRGVVPVAAALVEAAPDVVAGEGDAGARAKATASRSSRVRDELAQPFALPEAPSSEPSSVPMPLTPTPPPAADVPQAPEVPPAPTPPPAPEPPVAEPGSGLLGTEVVHDLGGAFTVVPGEAPAPGAGTVRSVRVEVEEGLPVDGEVLAQAVLTTLNDPRGWGLTDGVTFSRTAADDASIRVVLASPATTDRLCAPLQTESLYSCGNSVTGVAVLNFHRWVNGAADFGDDVATYRHYLVNHEVGHVLGHGHEPCPAPGAVAPVMLQQTITTDGCLPNGWPSP
ncbi:DUF3152 domain-containing protein [Cellulosimicrobium sp. NPDC057127]|uniref:DUF3152 domain-containing protein n=1 Tax=Cellulosimicrobium sp. NPDC057127 TaxID=3346026 RepID=UPI003645169B